jgi:hypothetical protein
MRILFLSLYPVDDAKHGGQLRSRALIEAYHRAGHTVQLAGVLGSEGYAQSSGFLSYPGDQRLSSPSLGGQGNEDYGIGRLCAEDPDWFKDLSANINGVPDLIHVEQPWLFDFASQYADSIPGGDAIQLVYGSQNIEHMLKKDILLSAGHPHYLEMTQRVEELEERAINRADAVICVSAHDLAWTRGNSSTPNILIPNGIERWQSTASGIQQANALSGNKKFALFCGSAHQPNVNGFATMFDGGFGALDFDQRLIVAGAAGYLISQHAVLQTSSKLADQTVIAGMVSSECLAGLLDTAHCLVLPLTQGGGTNLKTAEALWAGKHIVGTSVAMRGFERFLGSPGIHIADTPDAFKRAIREVMQSAPLVLDDQQRAERSTVLWEACVEPLSPFLDRIISKAS